MFENAAMHTDLLLTAKQAEMMAVLVERDQVMACTFDTYGFGDFRFVTDRARDTISSRS